MKTIFACAAFLGLAALSLSALPADVTYTEGDASMRLKTGKTQDIQIGDVMNTGDTLRTGKDGQAELDQKGVTIRVSHSSVFTLMERESSGKTAPVLSLALGSIKFRYDKITGQEPTVRTNGAVAGVRGTEFSVFSGADGSTLIAVDSGQVTVNAEGQSVELAAGQGVEVPLGQPPGGTFATHSDQVDYSTWNDEKLAGMLADPLAAMTSIETAMAQYIQNVSQYDASFKEYMQRLTDERARRAQIFKDKGADEASKYEQDVVSPLALETGYLGLNIRYYALAALSLRRFVAGRLYLFMKSRYIAHPTDPAWTEFFSRFNALLDSFEQSIAPQLVAADI
jgi:hypothetical protein